MVERGGGGDKKPLWGGLRREKGRGIGAAGTGNFLEVLLQRGARKQNLKGEARRGDSVVQDGRNDNTLCAEGSKPVGSSS